MEEAEKKYPLTEKWDVILWLELSTSHPKVKKKDSEENSVG